MVLQFEGDWIYLCDHLTSRERFAVELLALIDELLESAEGHDKVTITAL